ncbi:helix-turn-helix domain-containing protein [Patescibacteria group bacterium]|nr:MAG: helix-turn-helix domain-containing protein [Patescibacteria group bacterium]
MVCLWYMTTHKHTIQLSGPELTHLQDTIRKGKHNARVITRSRILLLSRTGLSKAVIAEHLAVNQSTVQDVRNRFRVGGIDRALHDAPRPGQPKKITDAGEAHLVALAASSPPEGEERWTLELLRQRMVSDGKAPKEITTVALWKRLTARHIKPWREKNVVRADAYAAVH